MKVGCRVVTSSGCKWGTQICGARITTSSHAWVSDLTVFIEWSRDRGGLIGVSNWVSGDAAAKCRGDCGFIIIIVQRCQYVLTCPRSSCSTPLWHAARLYIHLILPSDQILL